VSNNRFKKLIAETLTEGAVCHIIIMSLFAAFLGSSTVEHPAVNRSVAGSNPARGAKKQNLKVLLFLFEYQFSDWKYSHGQV
jgi:hypothetical protein